jgi:hypothetical protein
VDALKGLPVVDFGIVIAFFAFFVLGVAQGSIRRLLGIGTMLFAFLFAANLRDTVGDFFAGNWHQFDLGYNRMIAFGLVFLVGTVASSIVIQGFYRRTELNAQHPIIDDIVGGLLGMAQCFLILLLAVVYFNSYVLPPAQSGDVSYLRDAQDMIVNQSHIAGAIHSSIAPVFVHILAPLLLADLVALYP